MNTTIRYDGKPVGFRMMPDGASFIKTRCRIEERDICPICNNEFTPENTTSVILVISNQVDVPNRFCHTECLSDKTLEHAFQLILHSYEDAKEHIKWLKEHGWKLE